MPATSGNSPPAGLRTIIAGTRTISDMEPVNQAMRACGWVPSVVLCGGAPGVDTSGALWARTCGIPVESYPADWKAEGKAAGPVRNALMTSKADALVLVWDGKSPGSADVLERARSKGLRVFEWRADLGGPPPADALTLLRRLTTLHHSCRVDGDRLLIAPPPPADLAPLIREHKAALLEYVMECGGSVPGDPFLWEFPPPAVPAGWDGGDRPAGRGGGS